MQTDGATREAGGGGTAIAARLARCARKSIGEGEREEEPEERRRRCLPLGLQISKTAKEGALIMANKESVTRFTYSKSSINKLVCPPKIISKAEKGVRKLRESESV